MPFYLKESNLLSQLEGIQSVLIVPCRFCPAASLAVREKKPYLDPFRRLLRTEAYESFIKALQHRLGDIGVKTAVFDSKLLHQFVACMWTSKRRKQLGKRAMEFQAVIVLGCDAMAEAVRDAVQPFGCRVIQGLEIEGLMNVLPNLRFPLKLSLELQGVTSVDKKPSVEAKDAWRSRILVPVGKIRKGSGIMKQKDLFTFDVTATTGNCPIGERIAAENRAGSKIPVLSCEGGCIRGEIARLAANMVAKEEPYRRACHGELLTVWHSGMTAWVKEARKVVLIDGCFLRCHGRILENIVDKKKLVHFDALSHYKKYTDRFDIDSVPEDERKGVARRVADWVLESLKRDDQLRRETPCALPGPSCPSSVRG